METDLEDWTENEMARRPDQDDMKPFLFERSFDGFDTINRDNYAVERQEKIQAAEAEAKAAAEAAGIEAEEEVVEVVYSEEEFEKAKKQAYLDGNADGFREGHAEAMDTLEKQLNDLLESIKEPLKELQNVQARANDLAQANMARMMKELTAKLMPVYLRQHGAEEALQVISDCLSELQDAGRVTVHMNEETHDAIGERLKSVVQRVGFDGQLRLLIEEDYGPSDVRLDWGAGGAERRYDTIKHDIDAAIDRAVDRAEAEIEQLHSPTEDQVAEQQPAAEPEPPPPAPAPQEMREEAPTASQEQAAAPEPEPVAHTEEQAAPVPENLALADEPMAAEPEQGSVTDPQVPNVEEDYDPASLTVAGPQTEMPAPADEAEPQMPGPETPEDGRQE